MGVIDVVSWRMECPHCGALERVRSHARGAGGLGTWEPLGEPQRFAGTLSGGGDVMPEVTQASCKACASPARLTCEW